jgi:hypothetical protein
VFARAARTHARCPFAHHLHCLLGIAYSYRQQRRSRLGCHRAKMVQVLPTPSEHDVRVDAMMERDAGNGGAGD